MPNEKVALLELRKPLMDGFGGSSPSCPCAGVAHRKLVYNDKIIIRILLEDMNGNRIFPYDYEMKCREALQYPVMLLPDKVTPVHVIPISRLTQILTECPEPPITKGSFKDIVKKSQKVANRMSKLPQNELDKITTFAKALKEQEEKERNNAK
jgi:hypothetical protein